MLFAFSVSSVFGQGPVIVVTDKVVQKNFNNQIKLIGRTKGLIESNIVAEISGRVQSIETLEGTKVSKGQVLLSIDSQPILLLLQAKQAEALQAEVQAGLARDQKKRAVELRKNNLISESGLDSAIAWDAIQTAKFQKADAERSQLEIDFENTQIKAPYAGYTGRRFVDIGSWVTPGIAVFEMVNISKIKIIADLPEKYFGQLKIGSTVLVRQSSHDEILNGIVTGISPTASEKTHTYPVIIEVTNNDEILASGMLVQITLSLKKEFNSIAVPKDAIVRQGNNTIVYTIKDGKASLSPVTILATDGTLNAVQSPTLKIGMEVIVRGNERVYPGAAVMTGHEKASEDSQQTPENEAGE